ncbi:MAG: FkbM family methyltransferase [Xanthomonadaceae bacterium]|nr:FkbM family methyltransferase [Xanthomonadaceae bacterium]
MSRWRWLKCVLRPVYRTVLTPRWQEMLGQYRSGQVSERDIELFAHLEGVNGLVIDAGANRGQFALSLLSVNRSLNILGFEPNAGLRWALLMVALLGRGRFRFRLRGLSDRKQRLQLHVPVTKSFDLSSNASLDPDEFDKDYVQTRLTGYSHRSGGRYRFGRRRVRLIRLDALGLSPLAIKIDVEGWELQALKGMRETIERCHPLLMIELNNQHRFLPWLQDLGYRFYRYDPEARTLSPADCMEGMLNVFALHPHMPATVSVPIARHICRSGPSGTKS